MYFLGFAAPKLFCLVNEGRGKKFRIIALILYKEGYGRISCSRSKENHCKNNTTAIQKYQI